MSDLKADWQRWTRVEQISAWIFGAAATGLVPALLLLGQG